MDSFGNNFNFKTTLYTQNKLTGAANVHGSDDIPAVDRYGLTPII